MCLPILGLVFGISGGEFFVILLVIVVIVGPQRLPEYTRTLTQWVRKLRVFLDNTKQQIAEEVGPELGDLSLRDLDPRQYDPRKIVRDALGEDLDAIRRDFANPIQSVIDAGKDASTAAAATIAKDTMAADSRSLSEMIEDKANEKVEANAAAAKPAEAEDEPTEADSSEAAADSPATAESKQSDDAADAAAEPVEPDADAQASAESASDSDAEATSSNAASDEADGDSEASAEATQSDDAADAAAEPAPADIDTQASDDAADAVTETAKLEATTDGHEEAAAIAPTLVESNEQAAAASASSRPLSPREVLKAAKAAARNRQDIDAPLPA